MKDLIIFGAGRIADVVQHYLRHESDHNVVAFTVDREYATEKTFRDLPVIPFEEIADKHPPDRCAMFVALGYPQLNDLRAEQVRLAKEKGYELVTYIHPKANIPIDTPIGENCFIMNDVCIQPHVSIGDDVFIWSGSIVGHHSSIADHCWITSGANISGFVKLGKNCFLAINSTIGNEVTIGDRCFLGANSLVTKDLKDKSVVIEASTPLFRLDSDDFLRMTAFR